MSHVSERLRNVKNFITFMGSFDPLSTAGAASVTQPNHEDLQNFNFVMDAGEERIGDVER